MEDNKKILDSTNPPLLIERVSDNIFRPRNDLELLQALKENERCEIVNTHAIFAAMFLEERNCEFAFSYKMSKWNEGWAGFERFYE